MEQKVTKADLDVLNAANSEADEAKACQLLQTIAKRVPEAAYRLSKILLAEKKSGNQAKALEWLQEAADAGYPAAEYSMGQIYQGSNSDRAFEWFQKAANHGDAHAQYEVGMVYKNRGSEWWKLAIPWFEMAAKSIPYAANQELKSLRHRIAQQSVPATEMGFISK